MRKVRANSRPRSTRRAERSTPRGKRLPASPPDDFSPDTRAWRPDEGAQRRAQAYAEARQRLAERMRPPAPVSYDGALWDIVGVADDWTVELQRQGSVVSVALASSQVTLELDGARWQVRGTPPDSFELVGANGQLERFDARRLSPGSSVLYQGVPYRLEKYGAGVMTLRQTDAPARAQVPLASLGEVELRLRGEETQPSYRVSQSADDQGVIARRQGLDGQWVEKAIAPAQVEPRFVELWAPGFGEVQVDAFSLAHAREVGQVRVGGLEGPLRLSFARGSALLDETARQVLDAGGPLGHGPLHVSMYAIDLGSASTRRLVDALVERASRDEVTVVLNPGKRLSSEVAQRLREAGVEVVFPPQDSRGSPQFVHLKGYATPHGALFSTAPVAAVTGNKVEALVELPPSAAGLFYDYQRALAHPLTDLAKRRQLLGQLAERGVVLNDPGAGVTHLTRAVEELLEGAQKSLFAQVDELADLEATRTLVELARRGVQVDLRLRSLNPECGRLLEAARRETPSLPLTVKLWPAGRFPYPHVNVIVADDQRGYLGTAFLWSNQLSLLQPGGRSYEQGLRVDGEDARELRRSLDVELARSAT